MMGGRAPIVKTLEEVAFAAFKTNVCMADINLLPKELEELLLLLSGEGGERSRGNSNEGGETLCCSLSLLYGSIASVG